MAAVSKSAIASITSGAGDRASSASAIWASISRRSPRSMATAGHVQPVRDQRIFEFQHRRGQRGNVSVGVRLRDSLVEFELVSLDQDQLKRFLPFAGLAGVEIAQPVK
jgi:hypothetical protein